MKPLLIIKTGTTISSVAREHGDFENWIAAAAGLQEHQCLVSDVMRGAVLPQAEEVSGIVITGSAAMVTERLPWSEYTAGWLRSVVDTDMPILGICYGHQLLAHALGGLVDYRPQGREIGTTLATQTASAQNDPLFSGLPASFPIQVTHMQSVLQLPAGAEVLASNDLEAYQAVRFRESVWGVQFHPEFSSAVMLAYLEARAGKLLAEGKNVTALCGQVRATPEAEQLLINFARLLR